MINNNLNFPNNSNTQIVLWGQNLTSNVGYPQFTKIISNVLELPLFIKSIIYGLLLSDGWLGFAAKDSKNARIHFAQSLAGFPYLWFVFNTLSHYCMSVPYATKGKRNNTTTYAVRFVTRSLPCFTNLHSVWYCNGKKIIPNDIYDYLTPVALAHWIMGDGSVEKNRLVLCTDSYSNQEVVQLMNVLMIKYRLECTMAGHNKGVPRIYIKASSMAQLRVVVFPYIIPSMLYKIHL